MNNGISQFRNVMLHAGLEPPDLIEPGRLHRFPGVGKRNGNTAGWCKLFVDGRGGCFGDWSSGLTETWQSQREKPFTVFERDAFMKRVTETQAQAEAERKAQHAEAANRATAIWDAGTAAPESHPYLVRKGIKPHGARIHNDALLIPIRDNGELHSLQYIGADGKKRFLAGGRVAGCYFSIGNPQEAAALCIAEGYATGVTLHQVTGYPAAVAFNAGNLKAVAQAMQARFPGLALILCADDDAETEGNPGLTKATEAAQAVGGLLAVPDFGSDRVQGATDFNDMAAACGATAVNNAIRNARAPIETSPIDSPAGEPWPEPQPLSSDVASVPYPVDALPDTIRAAVEEVQGFSKAPFPMVASSALAALSLAIQALADAKRAEKLCGPVSLFLLTIADSGERKSTCDGFFTTAIRDFEEKQAELAKPALSDHTAASEAWEAKRSGIKEKIRQLAKENKPTVDKESALRELERHKPKPLFVPRLLYADATPEALAYGLSKNWPSSGVVSAEAGIVFGAHGMGKDSAMRNLALLNVLWDGGKLTIDRRSSESFVVRGARLTVALQVQEVTLRTFFDRTNGLARGTGFLARFLVAWPDSTQGYRPFSEAPANWPALAAFNARIATILEQPIPIDDQGVLSPPLLALAPEAKAAWVTFHDAIESELASGGNLFDVRDVASKTADNAVRLAALFHVFAGRSGAMSVEAFESASRIAAWHLNEARRFFGELILPPEMADAVRLDSWLTEYCLRHGTNVVPRREVQRNVTPVHLRQKLALECALRELIDAGRVQLLLDKRRKEIHINPALLKRCAT